uniref:Uncharacterized protein n=1 Tax=Arundo donax TaxID=35708 RepID=A0A0A8ZYA7_ARUDO
MVTLTSFEPSVTDFTDCFGPSNV